MIFKCKNCGGNTIYSPEKKALICPYCDSVEAYERKDGNSSGGVGVCPECGGTIPVEDFDSAVKCPYCDNSVIINERVEGAFLPKYIVPFELGRDGCKKIIRDRFTKYTFAPADFLSEVRLDSMEGVYVPFWFYDYNTKAIFEGEGTKSRSWTSGNYRYTETHYYAVVREMDIPFEKLPADASIKMPDDIMDLMEPYDYSKLADFKPEFLSGFHAEYYNMPAEEIEYRAQKKMENDAVTLLRGSISGYGSVRTNSQSIRVLSRNTDYGLMPVWRYVYQYKNKDYPFYVNGETGKIVGTAPFSKTKLVVYSSTIWLLLTAIMVALRGIINLL